MQVAIVRFTSCVVGMVMMTTPQSLVREDGVLADCCYSSCNYCCR